MSDDNYCDCSGFWQSCQYCSPSARRLWSRPVCPDASRPGERRCTVCDTWIKGKTQELRQHRAEAHGWIKGRQPPPKD